MTSMGRPAAIGRVGGVRLRIGGDDAAGVASSPARGVGRAFAVYAIVTTVAAVSAFAAGSWTRTSRLDAPALFAVLSALVIVGELMPIPVPRRHGLAKVTVSTAFAFAILLRFGAGPAALVYVASVVVADSVERVAPIKILFNAGQYGLAVAAAATVLMATGTRPIPNISTETLPAVIAAAIAFFVANHLLACVGAALLARQPIAGYIRDDLSFQAWTAGCVLGFAPAVVASSGSSLALVPMAFLPLVAIFLGGRQAALNSHRAYHDAVTELPNRALLTERVHLAVETHAASELPLSVLILDLDDFRAINETLGHEFGDLVLRRVGERLGQAIGEGTMLARLGGDEFAVLIDGGLAEAEACAQRLLAALDRTWEMDSVNLHLPAHIGIACCPDDGRSALDLLRHADVALHSAQASGTPVQTYAQEDDRHSADRLALAAQLRQGIERGELVVHYQPKLPLQGCATPGLEALVRWRHPQLGLISPDAFIPLAEHTGLIKPLTEKVLESALRQCRDWRGDGLDVSVAVNVSTRNLLDGDLPSNIEALLDRFSVPASMLQLEITESRIVADVRRARAALAKLRAAGVTIAIDDFGTGFASLAQLQQLPVDEIKIDQSFVLRMESNPNDAVLVRSSIGLAHDLGLRVTAEGVESEHVVCALRELGCDFAQGFHIGRPMLAENYGRYRSGRCPQSGTAYPSARP